MNIEISRKYKRVDVFWYGWHVETAISKDKQTWFKIEVPNISSGGLMLKTNILYTKGDTVWLNIYVNPKMLQFHDIRFQAKAIVQSVREVPDGYAVGVDFTAPQIYLDEVITRLSVLYGDLEIYDI